MLAHQLQTKKEERVESSSYRYAENEQEKGEASEILSGFSSASRMVR